MTVWVFCWTCRRAELDDNVSRPCVEPWADDAKDRHADHIATLVQESDPPDGLTTVEYMHQLASRHFDLELRMRHGDLAALRSGR